MKTENLAILITDIVGFTAATSQQSRSENERLLAEHNRILYPVLRFYGGKLIKTIGDALLIIFKSPTDAMLCAMAMQDALFEYNKSVPENRQIHIRVAASLGEVRVVNKDIFGEPVNLTSRIEGITPRDEIYLSDAVYMAMNKAEVPCVEVGTKTLKGISEPVKIWQIPRFSRPRLVPEDVMTSEDISDFAYPYGGAHLASKKTEKKIPSFDFEPKRGIIWGTAIVLFLIICFLAIKLIDRPGEQPPVDIAGSKIDRKSENTPTVVNESAGENIADRESIESAVSEDSKTSEVSSPVAAATTPVKKDSKVISSEPSNVSTELSPSKKETAVTVKQPVSETKKSAIMKNQPEPEIKQAAITVKKPVPETSQPAVNEIKTEEDSGTVLKQETTVFAQALQAEENNFQVNEVQTVEENTVDSEIDPEIAKLVESLHSYDSADRRRAAKIIARSYGNNPLLLEEVEKTLLSGYNEQVEDGNHVDAIAWLCRILGATHDERYRETLSTVANNAISRKVKKYADAALNDL